MRKQVSECDDSAAVKQDLASPVFIVQLAEKFAAASARRPRRAVRKYGDEADDPVDPQALRAAARVMAMTARARVCARFFIENSLRTAYRQWFSLPV